MVNFKMKFLLITFLLITFSDSAFSDDVENFTPEKRYDSGTDDEFIYNVSIGISPFDGFLGIEFQKRNHSIGIGLPGRVSYRFYSNPERNSPFYGLYIGRFEEQGDGGKKYKGVEYQNAEGKDGGIGAGYRWQWPSGWNVSAFLSIHYIDKEYSNPGQSKVTETSLLLFPGINVGFKF